jgi:hypothetical protein
MVGKSRFADPIKVTRREWKRAEKQQSLRNHASHIQVSGKSHRRE